MSDGPGTNENNGDEELTIEEKAAILANIPGVGPKTAEKLVGAGYDDLEKIAKGNPEEIAESVPGLSPAKAQEAIDEAVKLLEAIASGAVDLTGKTKKSKRKKAPEPEPDRHELPPMEAIDKVEPRTSLRTGLEAEKERIGIPMGPKWLTRFERARIVGARALQISMGAPVLINMKKAPKGLFALAEAELESGVLPMTVRRTKPTGEHADIPLSILLKNTRLA
ncbi:MAG: DNA-directed RNA polymerase subunit K [Candidatus Thorarchaeota archaeon]|nr:DNA-directed RNA polymerase subunit K [Candidatus Thorarchaeota archaeon]